MWGGFVASVSPGPFYYRLPSSGRVMKYLLPVMLVGLMGSHMSDFVGLWLRFVFGIRGLVLAFLRQILCK